MQVYEPRKVSKGRRDLGGYVEYLKTRKNELEKQNKKLQESLNQMHWRLMKSEMLKESLLKRIIQLKNVYEVGKAPEKGKTKMEKVLGFQNKTPRELMLEKIFEDEQFKKEIEEARRFKEEFGKLRT